MEHRIRLSDDDIEEIVAALAARRAMRRSAQGRQHLDRLIHRLDQCMPGNPALLRGGECIHGIDLAAGCQRCSERTRQYVGLANHAAPPTYPPNKLAEAIADEPWRDWLSKHEESAEWNGNRRYVPYNEFHGFDSRVQANFAVRSKSWLSPM